MPVEQQPPLLLAMILADAVLYDWTTGKSIIQGTYETLEATTFPFTQPSIVVYVALTEGYGDTELRLRLVDRDEARPPLFELETVVNFPDPVTTREVVFSQPKVVFPEPGEYRLQLWAAGQPLLERRLEIVQEESLGSE